MNLKSKISVSAITTMLCLVIFLTFGKCSTLEPHLFLHAPWRSDCKKMPPCYGHLCYAIRSYPIWMNQQELQLKEHLPDYEALASAGDLSAQNTLAHAYGDGVLYSPPLIEKAEEWYKMAAQQGDANAEYELAQIYLSNYRTYNDEKFRAKAEEQLLKSAASGHRGSIQTLDRFYDDHNRNKAYFWKFIQSCISDPQSPPNIAQPPEEILENCPKRFSQERFLGTNIPDNPQQVEAEAKEWIKTHKIAPHPPYSFVNF